MPATPTKAMLGVYRYLIMSLTNCAEQYIMLPVCMHMMLPASVSVLLNMTAIRLTGQINMP